ncbi:ABC transporter ATP-binding protein [Amylibacter marinus]|uniref:ABC transporter ATP-binding protein n=1 Tax=Amylibacter marinus TaxID=1475483 RepID=A0ABQ5VUY6_9RHOB|nr:ATP-binding cassette domain-containing protein [Amylibacter marinus]GLQ35066.1 ABC transporter ATP-binding protein [Amylibacter marinus]
MIELKKAGFSYGGGEIFRDVDLHLAQGTFHFLTGPSGTGKTTLMKMCYQALMPDSGTIKVFGRDVRAMNRDDVALVRRRIGVVHQDCQFLNHLSVGENVLLPSFVAGRDGLDDQRNLRELLKWVELEENIDQLPPELSGGERQRAALARAVILSPEVILADEPTGNLDWNMAQRLLTLLIELNKMGKTILVATHDMNLIRAARPHVAARVLRIQGKRVHLAGADL